MSTRNPPTLLIIRDGWGHNPHADHDAFNAVKLARTPVADQLFEHFPSTYIRTSGEDVGLPNGADGPVMGNSEVGHQNIGAGRIVDQELMRITRSIRSGAFFKEAALDEAFAHVEANGKTVHLVGLISDGQVHSDLEHLLALIQCAKKRGLPSHRLRVHAITDGRDTPPQSGQGFLATLEDALNDAGYSPVASVMGRFWAMDRDHRWERVERAYRCLVGEDINRTDTAKNAVINAYERPEDPTLKGDEFIPPTSIGMTDEDARAGRIQDGDSVIFFNFRGDRPREITRAFVLEDDEWAKVQGGGFTRTRKLKDLKFTGLTRYEKNLPIEVVFEKPEGMPSILGETVCDVGLSQFRCAETEKFPHVTFFFNDYREEPFDREHRSIVPSPKDVTTYDLKPEMSAHGVRDAVLNRIHAKDCESLLIVNFANGDMVGHTGSLPATITACETVDQCVGDLLNAMDERGGSTLVTADHGNAEQMWNPVADCPHTAHTNYQVPLHIAGEAFRGATLRDGGRLADLAPTLLNMMALEKPEIMHGNSLLT